ncbi:potassium-transporting ATPase subunit KdpA [Nitratidesulfovibrio sp. SRB-5]|uniref:potassium-transporting ATPase subunit KdpA n=1 Tax=Nitratidesulfovibrio sp. SRB-5 TaxID=2872636 RepID=UPI0010250189|nr:potassium-transporting ATPase subunit KdpA [Nitratidesulfovibrio sp. SRB-5]MBZ2170751.1 potassium-transporting ATPase subunit KdpA [Nitratidesulfovibrio sp. SRB-5]RXF75992.1 potassium-transporting ATPase subunit KdpA [Desulfovibrio sp. DS-1]
MTPRDYLQLALFLGILAAASPPLGRYIHRVLEGGRTWLHPLLGPVERLIYTAAGIDPASDQPWQRYAASLLGFTLAGFCLTFGVLLFQDVLPLNPQHFPAPSWDLALNTAVSFVTNTNWQAYGGETAMSHLSQVVALTYQNFVSAAVGMAACMAVVRGIARTEAQGIGNFWADMVRSTLYVLLPLCVPGALLLVGQGMVQTLAASFTVATPEGAIQTIAVGPVASQAIIKMLGTNGGGFFNANAAHPFENPTAVANFIQMLAIFLLPSSLVFTLGAAVRRPRHAWTVWGVMAAVFVAGTLLTAHFEYRGTPAMAQAVATGSPAASGPSTSAASVPAPIAASGVASPPASPPASAPVPVAVSVSVPNMEGKEVRFGIFSSSLFAVVTTDASCGAVNAMHDSLTPLGGLVTLLNMQLGEIIFGGVGSGLYGMVLFIILTVFLAGLMVGRTPDYLGKRIEGREVTLAVAALLLPALPLLGFTALAAVGWGPQAMANAGAHGFSELLYAYTSSAQNNGSAFAGLTVNSPVFNLTTAASMLIGRFGVMLPMLAVAGSLAARRPRPVTDASFPVEGATFALLLASVILIVGALTYLPALSLGPIVEHLQMIENQLY